jgi:trans-aconitate 2-methyltransferase
LGPEKPIDRKERSRTDADKEKPMPAWDAERYLQFADERTQPARDLIARVALPSPGRIADLGCGPGNSTAALRARWPGSRLLGLDSSPEMIAKAKASDPDVRWVLGDLAEWEAKKPFDLVFSNAALQWVPHHETVFPRLMNQVAGGGALAVQMPFHHESPLHQILLDVAGEAAWRLRMTEAKQALTRKPPAFYYDTLRPLAAKLDLWITEYYHILEGPEGILDWFRGTGLRPFLEALSTDEERARFEALLLKSYSAAYPRRPDGRVLFPFKRLFLIAYQN